MVRHAPDRPRTGKARALAHALPRRDPRRPRRHCLVGRAAVYAAVALYVSGINADHMPAGLHEDRARLHGLPPPSIEAVRKAAIRNLHLVRPQIAWLAEMLQDGRRYLLGDQPSIADFAAYHVVWFFKGRHIDCRQEFTPYPRLLAWRDRMATIGHGQRSEIDRRRGARRCPQQRARGAAGVTAAGRRSTARRTGARAPVGQCQGLGRGRSGLCRRAGNRPGAPGSRRGPRGRALPAARIRLAAHPALA